MICAFSVAYGQTKTAVSNNGNWHNPNTWSPVGEPGDNDIILIPDDIRVVVRGTDHVLNNAVLIVEGDLVMESTCWICANYGSLTFTGSDAGIFLEEGARVLDGTALGGDTHFISVLGQTFWSGDNCNANCGIYEGNQTASTGGISFPEGFSNPLPVELLSFTTESMNGGALLKWVTASELNNSHFDIERSLDGSHFFKVGKVEGSGTTTIKQNYMFEDTQIDFQDGYTFYYRLKQVDFDGQFEYSPIVVVYIDYAGLEKVWPGQFEDVINIQLSETAYSTVLLRVFDLQGKIWLSEERSLFKGLNELELSGLYECPAGIYVLEIVSDRIRAQKKLIKL